MTVRELSKLYYLDKLIQRDRTQLSNMRDRLIPGGIKLTGMPCGKGHKSLVEELVPLIDELEHKINDEIKQYLKERIIIENYIRTVPDYNIRLIMSLRFVDLMTWQAIALKIGGGNTADSVRKACNRYLKSVKK